MKSRVSGNLLVLTFLIIVVTFASCHKENTNTDYNSELETVADYVETQQITDLLLNTYFKAITDSTLLADGTALIDSANVTYTMDPPIISIDYNTWGREDSYGHFRKGKYEATTTVSFFDPSAIVSFSFSKFYYDSDLITVEGMSLTNTDVSTENDFIFTVEIQNMQRVFHDTTGILAYSLQQNFTRIKDQSSQYYTTSDYFEISGSLEGNDRYGRAFNGIIQDTDPLISAFSCNWILRGASIIEIPTIELVKSCDVNFSNEGECLNQYSVTINGSQFVKAFDK